MRLLLAVDSVTTLNILLDEVTARSWPRGTKARVLSVVEDGEVPLETFRKEGYGVAAFQQEMRRRGKQITTLAVETLRAIGIETEVTIMRGSPAMLIPFASRKWSTDLILIRAHNRSDFRNWLLGSVSKAVVENAFCSVEVIRSVAVPDASVNKHDFRILLATDGSSASLTAAQAVARSNWVGDTEVRVVSVINPVISALEETGLFRDRRTQRAHRAIGEATRPLRDASLRVTAEVVAGGSTRGIIDRARHWGADLIVVGTHDRRGLKRSLLGSTSAAVANRAHCSVRVVRGRPDASLENVSAVRQSRGLKRVA